MTPAAGTCPTVTLPPGRHWHADSDGPWLPAPTRAAAGGPPAGLTPRLARRRLTECRAASVPVPVSRRQRPGLAPDSPAGSESDRARRRRPGRPPAAVAAALAARPGPGPGPDHSVAADTATEPGPPTARFRPGRVTSHVLVMESRPRATAAPAAVGSQLLVISELECSSHWH